VVPVLAINKQTGAIDGLPDVITRGLVLEPNGEDLLREASRLILDALGAISAEERTDRGLVTEKVRAEMRRFFRKRSGRRPLVLPVIMEI
jgi:ribonuclease J